jgi:hypothetical protein
MRTLNDITPPSKRRDEISSDTGPLRIVARPPRFPFATFFALIAVIAASVGALFYFSVASVEVTPTTASATVQSTFSANQAAGALPYEMVSAQKIASQSVAGSGTKAVTSNASGMITVYNTQTKAQHLVTNTRFASTGGLVFRVRQAVTVPGGSTARPGTVSVRVYADQPGSTYNVGPTSFTVPGFAGTPQATAVYARSTSAMTGGSSGTEPVVDAALEGQTRVALVKALQADLRASLEKQIPPGYVLLEGAATTTYEALPSAPSATAGMVEIKEQGTITAVVFANKELAKAVASSVLGLGYQGGGVRMATTSALRFSVAAFPDPAAQSFSFSLTGTTELIYEVDPTALAASIAGKTRSAAEVALTNYPEVKRAVLILRPFWRQTFPEDPSGIKVTVAKP